MGFFDKVKKAGAGFFEIKDSDLPAPLRDRGRKEILEHGSPATAKVWLDDKFDIDSESRSPLYNNTCRLEVHRPPDSPYEVYGLFSVVTNFRYWATPGIELPVKVDPANRERVAIDWENFEASGARDAAERAAVANRNRPAAADDGG